MWKNGSTQNKWEWKGERLWRLYVFDEEPVPHTLEAVCLMNSVFPIWLDIKIWSKKPWESHLQGDAGGERACVADPQQSKKCVRALGFGQASCCGTAEHSICGGGVNRAINNLLPSSNVNVSVALNCFCRPFYASPAPVP